MGTITRTTEHRVDVPDETRVHSTSWYGTPFRVTAVRETYREGGVDRDGEPVGAVYAVHGTGPKLTAKGNDHATQTDSRTWSDKAGKLSLDDAVSEVPAELAALLVGREALAGWTA